MDSLSEVTPELQALRDKLSSLQSIYDSSVSQQESDEQRLQVCASGGSV